MLKHLSIKEKRALEEFKKTLLKEFGREILELRIFGSKSRGDFKKTLNAGEMSDTDVFVILKKHLLKKRI